jgi:N-acyl-D-aspartate/D-glutamate deacylase
MHDLVIRGETAVDGRGSEPGEADVVIEGGRMVDARRSVNRDPAMACGLPDRGVVATRHPANLNVIDFYRLRLPAPYLCLRPAGGRATLAPRRARICCGRSHPRPAISADEFANLLSIERFCQWES